MFLKAITLSLIVAVGAVHQKETKVEILKGDYIVVETSDTTAITSTSVTLKGDSPKVRNLGFKEAVIRLNGKLTIVEPYGDR